MKSQLVKDTETGELCIQVSLGQHTATLPLPADCVNWHHQELQAYMEKVVPDMIESLQQRVRAERRTIFKRAKRESDS